MESKVLTETFKDQIASINPLGVDEKYIATIQTLRMSLVMLKYSIKREDLYHLFDQYDIELTYLLYCEEPIGEYTQDEHKDECCVAKEDFSDDDKEDSSWASRISAEGKERKVVKLPKGKEEGIAGIIMRTTGPIGVMVTESDPVTPKQHDLLVELASYGFLIKNYRKFLDILEMYRDEHVSVIKSTNVFEDIFERGHGNILLNYLEK